MDEYYIEGIIDSMIDDINYVRFNINDDPNAVLGNYSLGDVFSKRSDLILY